MEQVANFACLFQGFFSTGNYFEAEFFSAKVLVYVHMSLNVCCLKKLSAKFQSKTNISASLGLQKINKKGKT